MTENSLSKGICAIIGYRYYMDEVMEEIRAIPGVESVDQVSPECLHDILIKVAAEVDLNTVIMTIAAIRGVDQAYRD